MNVLHNLIDDYQVLRQIGNVADQLRLDVYVIGGFVRDLLLNRPSKDIDIVCVGDGVALAHEVGNLWKQPVNVFKTFGTAMIRKENWDVEFVGARKESYSSTSRKPFVEPGTLQDDQLRRDFTINALAISLNASSWGELIDPFGGIQDLHNQILRTPLDPAITFSDDPLRMMRAIRFSAQLNIRIDPQVFAAIKSKSSRLKIVSQERITSELNKIILAPIPSIGFRDLDDSGLLNLFFPEMTLLKGTDRIGRHGHKDNFYHTLEVLDNIAKYSDDLWLRWAAILHDIAKPSTKLFSPLTGFTFHGHDYVGANMVPEIFRRLKLPLDKKMRHVQNLVRLHLRPITIAQDIVTDSAVRRLIYEAGETIHDLMKLCRADVTSKNPSKIQKYLANFDRVESKIQLVEEQDRIRNFQPIITGEIIMKTFNLKPCRLVGVIKEQIRNAILDGIIPNEHDSSYEYMIFLGEQQGLI